MFFLDVCMTWICMTCSLQFTILDMHQFNRLVVDTTKCFSFLKMDHVTRMISCSFEKWCGSTATNHQPSRFNYSTGEIWPLYVASCCSNAWRMVKVTVTSRIVVLWMNCGERENHETRLRAMLGQFLHFFLICKSTNFCGTYSCFDHKPGHRMTWLQQTLTPWGGSRQRGICATTLGPP